ncbi:MAG: AMP-binding protein, partial [Pseudomonadota bacterium]
MNFYTTLDTGFTEYAERDCLRLVDGSVWSYATLQDYVARLGNVLCERGVEPGDRVVVQVQKSAANLALYLATLRVGAVYVPLNTAYTPQELDYFVEDAGPALFVGHSERQDVPSLTLDEQGTGSLHDAVQACQVHAAIAPRQADDLAAIVYTSGTTGRSKGAMLSHHNLASNAAALTEAWGWQQDDVLLHALPIFHVHGLFIASHCALLNGSAMQWLPRFDVDTVLQALPDATVMMGVPTFYVRLLGQSDFPA